MISEGDSHGLLLFGCCLGYYGKIPVGALKANRNVQSNIELVCFTGVRQMRGYHLALVMSKAQGILSDFL